MVAHEKSVAEKEQARPMDGPWRLAVDCELISRSSSYAQDCPGPEDVAMVSVMVRGRKSHGVGT